ncbi:MAG: histidine kinase dimerization/phospho-acceptor domain-containing protein [Myxococcota bacterium]
MRPSGGQAVEQRRASFVQTFGLLATVLSVVLAGGQMARGRWDLALINGLAAALCVGAPVLVWFGRVAVAAVWLTAVSGVATVFGVLESGLAGSTTVYVALVPVVGALAGGARLGALSLGLVMVTTTLIGWFLDAPLGGAQSSVGMSLTGALFVALVAVCSFNLAKSRLLANCSHDLRTPLNAVLGYADLLRDEAEDAGAVDEVADLDRIEHAARRLLGRVNRVLDLARIEAERVTLAPRVVVLNDEVTSAAIDAGTSVASTIHPGMSATLDVDVLRLLVVSLVESSDRKGVTLAASQPRSGWLRLEAPTSLDTPTADIAGTVVERLAERLGGVSAEESGMRWVEVPVA